MPEYQTVLYENLTPEIVRVRMNRPRPATPRTCGLRAT